MPQYNGVEKQELVQSIEDAMDYILSLKDIVVSKDAAADFTQPLNDWIDGRLLAILKQSSSSEELCRNMAYTGADTLFGQYKGLLLSARFNDVTASTQKTIRSLEKWKAFQNTPKNTI
tara:strand:+ start:482 stop:835 length:354 start_codon:yes stop_codon:yes gene_type:complete